MKFRKPKSPATKTIEFRLKEEIDERVFVTPEPGNQHVPKWFKDMPRFLNGEDKLHLRPLNLTGKWCVPIVDGFTSGYYVVTPYELQVSIPQKVLPKAMLEDPNISFDGLTQDITHSYPGLPAYQKRDLELAKDFPPPAGYHPGVWVWETTMQIITPPGYSVWFMHPSNRYDLPFITASGIIDTDKTGGLGGSIPFYLRKDFEGIIPKGTPIIQIFPFKRDNWQKHDSDKREDLLGVAKSRMQASGFYKQHNWNKKKFE
jgi:hypothetical protein